MRGVGLGLGFERGRKPWAPLAGSVLDIDFASARIYQNGVSERGIYSNPEKISNGGFDSDTVWIKKTPLVGTETVTISGGTLNLTGDGTNAAYADQSIVTEVGKLYVLTYTTNSSPAVSIGTSQGGNQLYLSSGIVSGTWSHSFVATSTTTWVRFSRTGAVLTTIDNVSVREAQAGGNLVANGEFTSDASSWNITGLTTYDGGRLRLAGNGVTGASANHQITTVAGKAYRLTWTHTNGRIDSYGGTNSGGTQLWTGVAYATPGTQVRYFTATGATTWIGFLYPTALTDFTTLDDVKVEEVTAISALPGLTVVRASPATTYAETSSGALVAFAANQARITDKGLLVEEARTNSIPNNGTGTAVDGSPGTPPLNWAFSAAAGLTRTITKQTRNGVDGVLYSYRGTPSANTAFGINFSAINAIAAADAQSWTGSMYVQFDRVVGIPAGNWLCEVWTYDGAQAFLSTGSAPSTGQYDPTTRSDFTRLVTPRTLSGATIAFARLNMRSPNVVIGTPIELDVFIGLPQLELGAFATSPIPTTSGAVTRDADYVVMPGLSYPGPVSLYGHAQSASHTLQTSVAMTLSAASNDNRMRVGLYTSSGGRGFTDVASGAVAQGFLDLAVVAANTPLKMAGGLDTNMLRGASAGAASVTGEDTVITLPVGPMTQINFGGAYAASPFVAQPLNGYLRRAAVFPTLQSAAQLQALTA